MKIETSRSFQKDLKKLPPSTKENITKVIQFLYHAKTIDDFPALTKLKGYPNSFRIRIGDYRIGLHINDGRVILARVLHRKDMYKKFP